MGEDNWNLLFQKVKKQHKTNVGASLLAMADCQSTLMLNVQPPSPAG
jgi:hypothetical protein